MSNAACGRPRHTVLGMTNRSEPPPAPRASRGVAGWQLEVGRQVKRFRVEAGLTQAELAARSGTSQPAIANLEAGRRTPTLITLGKLAQALGRDVTLVVPCDRRQTGCSLS